MLRKHFNATTIIAIVALVFAMTGGAYAVAGKGGGGNAAIAAKKKSKKPAAKGVAGPRGPEGKEGKEGKQGAEGKAGPAGPAGPVGPEGKGTQGATGHEGAVGATGAAGTNGKSIVAENEATKTANCEGHGGTSFHEEGSATKHYACNGKEGSPWTAGGKLPTGATETGTWKWDGKTSVGASELIDISFSIPTKTGVKPHYVSQEEVARHEYPEEGGKKLCEGSAAEPEAASGNLCVFVASPVSLSQAEPLLPAGPSNPQYQWINPSLEYGLSAFGTVGNQGVLMGLTATGTEVFAWGSWAVTG